MRTCFKQIHRQAVHRIPYRGDDVKDGYENKCAEDPPGIETEKRDEPAHGAWKIHEWPTLVNGGADRTAMRQSSNAAIKQP